MTREEFGARLVQGLQAGVQPDRAAPLPRVAVGVLETALYPLAPGDSLDLAVEGEPDLTGLFLVMDDGKINMPLVGETEAGGLPVSVFVSRLAESLKEFIIAPRITLRAINRAPRDVYISGAVSAPGRYSAWEYPTVLGLLAGAGGLTSGADPSRATITRGGQKQLLRLDEILAPEAEEQTDFPLLHGDRIVIPSAEPALIHVTGQVSVSGAQPFIEGDRVSTAIARAGGTAPTAASAHAGVLRGGQWIAVDLEALLAGNVPEADIALQAGDVVVVPSQSGQFHVVGAVANPGPYTLQQAGTVLEALSLAGGPGPSAAPYSAFLVRDTVAVALDLDKLMTEGDPALDLALEDGDRLVVPEAKRTVFVWGQVARPGAYPIRPGDSYMDIIGQAGGLLPTGRHQKILIVRRGTAAGEHTRSQLRDLARLDPSDEQWVPQPGDLVWVPTQEEASRQRLLRYVGGIASGALIYGLFR